MIDELHRKISRLNMELDWVKSCSSAAGTRLVGPSYKELSVCRQCELIGLPRSTGTTSRPPVAGESGLMRRIDGVIGPRFGSRMMVRWPAAEVYVNRKRMRRLIR